MGHTGLFLNPYLETLQPLRNSLEEAWSGDRQQAAARNGELRDVCESYERL